MGALFSFSMKRKTITKDSRVWRHEKTGNLYEIMLFSRDKTADCKEGLQVIYHRFQSTDGVFYNRPIDEFLEKFSPSFMTEKSL